MLINSVHDGVFEFACCFCLLGMLCCSSELGFQEIHDWLVCTISYRMMLYYPTLYSLH